MKNIKYIALGLLMVALVVGAGLSLGQGEKVEGATDVGNEYTDTNIAANSAATSTVSYLTTSDAASSTIVARISGADSFDFNLCATASSSAVSLTYQLAFSVDDVATTSKTWFYETDAVAGSSGAVTHTRLEHSVSLATTTLGTNYSCVNILTDPTSAKYVRIKMGVVGGNTSIWRAISPKASL